MESQYLEKRGLPDTPGVYFFKKGSDILYIGKATSLRDRVRSYFSHDLIKTRGVLLVDMVTQATSIDFEPADSVLEAFIRESELIKLYQPRYNTKEKDNKSFNYVVITEEDFPRVLVVRGRNLEQEDVDFSYRYLFGPYPFGTELREAMKLIRKIFPYRDNSCTPLQGKPCFNRTIGLCPGVCTGEMNKADYKKQINHIKLFFEGKKQRLVSTLKKEMIAYAKEKQFERAGEVKHTLQSLMHIQDISMMKKERVFAKASKGAIGDEVIVDNTSFRMESYDIAHMSGKNMVGVMVTMTDGEFDKQMYRKFIIRTVDRSNDTAALQEVLRRRFNHPEWGLPTVIVIDGGKGQINAAEKVLSEVKKKQLELDAMNGVESDIAWPIIISVVKDDRHKARGILGEEKLKNSSKEMEERRAAHIEQVGEDTYDAALKDDIISINAEAHRFAITFHKNKRQENQGFLPRSKTKKRRP